MKKPTPLSASHITHYHMLRPLQAWRNHQVLAHIPRKLVLRHRVIIIESHLSTEVTFICLN